MKLDACIIFDEFYFLIQFSLAKPGTPICMRCFSIPEISNVIFYLAFFLNSLAEPVDKLQKSYEQFLQRMERKNNKRIQVVTCFFSSCGHIYAVLGISLLLLVVFNISIQLANLEESPAASGSKRCQEASVYKKLPFS